MPAENFEQLLARAASLFGIEEGFSDIWGHYHQTTVEAKQAILRALGADAGSAEELERWLASVARAESRCSATIAYCESAISSRPR